MNTNLCRYLPRYDILPVHRRLAQERRCSHCLPCHWRYPDCLSLDFYPYVYIWKTGAYVDSEEADDGEDLDGLWVTTCLAKI